MVVHHVTGALWGIVRSSKVQAVIAATGMSAGTGSVFMASLMVVVPALLALAAFGPAPKSKDTPKVILVTGASSGLGKLMLDELRKDIRIAADPFQIVINSSSRRYNDVFDYTVGGPPSTMSAGAFFLTPQRQAVSLSSSPYLDKGMSLMTGVVDKGFWATALLLPVHKQQPDVSNYILKNKCIY